MIPTQAWSKEREAILRKCVLDGLSSGITSQMLGITRNAAMGKASRLGLSFRSVPGHKRNKSGGKTRGSYGSRFMTDFRRKDKPVQPEAPAMVPQVEVDPLNLTMEQFKDSPIISECRFITAEGPVLYCGLPVSGDCSWCLGHLRIVYPTKRAA